MTQLVSAEKLFELNPMQATILDVRTPMEYGFGTVRGSVNASFDYEEEAFDEDALEVLAELPKDRATYVFCHTGPRSELAVEALEEMGFAEVYDIDGGWRAYQRLLAQRDA